MKERGLLSLLELRNQRCDFVPGGNQWSHDADGYRGVDRYVHLSFTNNHPMEYVAKQEGRIEQSVVLKVRPTIIGASGARISLGVANASGVEILDAKDAIEKLDLAALYPKQSWRDDETWERFKIAQMGTAHPGCGTLEYD